MPENRNVNHRIVRKRVNLKIFFRKNAKRIYAQARTEHWNRPIQIMQHETIFSKIQIQCVFSNEYF